MSAPEVHTEAATCPVCDGDGFVVEDAQGGQRATCHHCDGSGNVCPDCGARVGWALYPPDLIHATCDDVCGWRGEP